MTAREKNILFLLIIAFLSTIVGCSHKTLSIFFDGVPQNDEANSLTTDTTQNNDKTLTNNTVAAPTQFYHPPYQSKECSGCHDRERMGKFVLPQPDLCYQCHDDFRATYRFVHAPVEGNCTDCHIPHIAKYDKLLIMPAPDLCFTCHDKDDSEWKEIHIDFKDQGCLECHNPHGGPDETFLK